MLNLNILSFNQFERGKTSRDKGQKKKRETVNVSSKSQNTRDRLCVVAMKGTTQQQQQHIKSFVMRKSGDTLPQRLWVLPLLPLLLQAACLLSKEGQTEKTTFERQPRSKGHVQRNYSGFLMMQVTKFFHRNCPFFITHGCVSCHVISLPRL